MAFPPRKHRLVCTLPYQIKRVLQLPTLLGAAGRKLMLQDVYSKPNPNFKGEFD